MQDSLKVSKHLFKKNASIQLQRNEPIEQRIEKFNRNSPLVRKDNDKLKERNRGNGLLPQPVREGFRKRNRQFSLRGNPSQQHFRR